MRAERSFEAADLTHLCGRCGAISPQNCGNPHCTSPHAPTTRQAIFERVVRHYRKQPRRCPPGGRCFYRFDGDMCFTGPLIDDAYYDPDMEGYRVHDLLKAFAMPVWFRANISFIEELQMLHDAETNWAGGRMEMILELFAAERGLEIPT